jgi:hypothetical protein
MDSQSKSENESKLDPKLDPKLEDAQADALLEEKQKHSTSGLSWDEVAKDDKKGWNQITEIGEGD